MIIDTCMFNNEYDVLKLRIQLLQDKVDHMVVVEADHTHSGQRKPHNLSTQLQVDPELALLANAMGPRIHFLYKPIRPHPNRMEMDNRHRLALHNAILPFLMDQADIVMVSDVDEIPDMTTWSGWEGVFQQRHSYYSFDMVDPRPWRGTTAVRAWRFFSPWGSYSSMTTQDMRNFRDILQVVGNGWHFGWLGDEKRALEKISNSAHSELEEDKYQRVMHSYTEGVHPADGTRFITTLEGLPEVCYRYPQYFRGVV